MPDGLSYFGANLTKAVKNGEVSEDRVTDMAVRIAAAWYKMGQDNKVELNYSGALCMCMLNRYPYYCRTSPKLP